MLYGIVDIGSNTIRLKIYEYKNNKIKSVFSKKKTAGLIAYRDDGKLNDEGINILSSILNKFNKIMNLLNNAKPMCDKKSRHGDNSSESFSAHLQRNSEFYISLTNVSFHGNFGHSFGHPPCPLGASMLPIS